MKYSVIIPVYNGSSTLEELFIRIKQTFENLKFDFEVVFIDDFSADSSWTLITSLKSYYPEEITGIKLSKNFGQHHATLCGIMNCKGNNIITIDDDLESQPDDIPLLIKKQKESGADLVYGTNRKISRISLRGILRGVFTNTYRQMSKLEGKNRGRGSSFRLMTRSLGDKISSHAGNFIFIDEFCLWHTEKIAFAEVSHHKTKKKQSRYTLAKLFSFTSDLIFSSTLIPLRLLTYFGLIMALFNFLLGLWFIYKKIVYHVPLGYTSIILSILFTAGIILLCIGILGEYLGVVVRASAKMPPYSIEEKI